MNIMFDAEVFEHELTGVAKSMYYLFLAAGEIDLSFHAYGICNNCEIVSKYETDNIHFVSFECKSNDYLTQIKKFIIEHDIKIIHFINNKASLFGINECKKILTLHDVIPLENPRSFSQKNLLKEYYHKYKYRKTVRKSIESVDYITTVSNYSKKQIIKYFNPNKEISVIHHGVTLPSEVINHNKYGKYFLFLGGYDRRKGIDFLVDAFVRYKNETSNDIRLVICGKKRTLGKTTDKTIKNGVNKEWIVETGYLPDEMVVSLLKNAIAMYYLSWYEGFGLPIIEAMKNNCPVITTKGTCLPEIGGDAVMYVEREETSIVNSMKDILNQDLRQELIEKGEIRVRNFEWKNSAMLYLDLLHKVSNETKNSSS